PRHTDLWLYKKGHRPKPIHFLRFILDYYFPGTLLNSPSSLIKKVLAVNGLSTHILHPNLCLSNLGCMVLSKMVLGFTICFSAPSLLCNMPRYNSYRYHLI